MRFGTHLAARGASLADAAEYFERNVETIRLWVAGKVIPRKGEVEAIYVWSGGQVRPEDWYDLPDLDDLAETTAATTAEAPRFDGAPA